MAVAAVAGASRPAHREELIFKARSLSVTVEQVVGARNVPLVLLDAALEAQVKDWSAKVGGRLWWGVELPCIAKNPTKHLSGASCLLLTVCG